MQAGLGIAAGPMMLDSVTRCTVRLSGVSRLVLDAMQARQFSPNCDICELPGAFRARVSGRLGAIPDFAFESVDGLIKSNHALLLRTKATLGHGPVFDFTLAYRE